MLFQINGIMSDGETPFFWNGLYIRQQQEEGKKIDERLR
jgi:hypothetical protein